MKHKRREQYRNIGFRKRMGFPRGTIARPDSELKEKEREETQKKALNLTPWDELSEMEAMGWGDTPRCDIPEDWRTRRGPD